MNTFGFDVEKFILHRTDGSMLDLRLVFFKACSLKTDFRVLHTQFPKQIEPMRSTKSVYVNKLDDGWLESEEMMFKDIKFWRRKYIKLWI